MPERNIEALTQLRRVVEAAPDDLWDMNKFTTLTRCGTAHCAAGWFAVDPWARENTRIGIFFDRKGHPMQSLAVVIPGLSEIFGIDNDQTCDLFFIGLAYDKVVEKHEVIDNIDRLLCGLDTIPYGQLVREFITA